MDSLLCCLAALGLHIGSAHLAPAADAPTLSNANVGAYTAFTNGVVVGALRNSLGRPSAYLAYDLRLPPVAGLSPSIIVGGITGYPRAAVSLLVLPSVYVPVTAGAGVRLGYIPKTRATAAHVRHLAIEYRFH